MANDLSWDEFRLVKAIAESQSLVGAAEALGLNHSTVFRRLAALEAAVGVRLFERARSGYQPTAAGEEMIEVASSMGESIVEFERRIAGRDIKPTGLLRLTALEGMATDILPTILARFREVSPGIHVEVILSLQDLSLSRRDADVALRATNDPGETLVGRKICPLRWGIYCSPEFARRWGDDVVAGAPWIVFGENFGPQRARRWYDENIEQRRQVCGVNSIPAMAALAATGLGAVILPCFIGGARSDLVRIGAPLTELDVGLWLLTHADLRHSARVRAFMDFAGVELVKQRKMIEGDLG